MTETAFQPDAFQNDAFQIISVPVAVGGRLPLRGLWRFQPVIVHAEQTEEEIAAARRAKRHKQAAERRRVAAIRQLLAAIRNDQVQVAAMKARVEEEWLTGLIDDEQWIVLSSEIAA